MTQQNGAVGFGSLHPGVLDEMRAADEDGRLSGGLDRLAQAYGHAMLWGQTLELAAKIAEPALMGPLDEQAARGIAARARRRSLRDAIDMLADADGGQEMQQIVDALHAARRKRNELAHDFWWSAFPAVLTGGTDDVLQQLQSTQEEFQSLIQTLFDATLRVGIERRGIAVEKMVDAVSLVAGLFTFRPADMRGLHLLDDGDVILERLKALLSDPAAGNPDEGV